MWTQWLWTFWTVPSSIHTFRWPLSRWEGGVWENARTQTPHFQPSPPGVRWDTQGAPFSNTAVLALRGGPGDAGVSSEEPGALAQRTPKGSGGTAEKPWPESWIRRERNTWGFLATSAGQLTEGMPFPWKPPVCPHRVFVRERFSCTFGPHSVFLCPKTTDFFPSFSTWDL